MDPHVTQVLKRATTHLLYRLGGVHNSVVRQDTCLAQKFILCQFLILHICCVSFRALQATQGG